jgi:hypothetical protein
MRGVSLRFLLPRTAQVVHATGDFIWADREGRAGLFFSHMPQACRRDLQSWLKKYGVRKSGSDKHEQRFAPASVSWAGISAAASNAR